MTTYDLSVLRALVRLARRRAQIDTDALALRAGGSPASVRAALARLVRGGLVSRTPARGVVPTLSGLAIAVASAALVFQKRAASPKQVPMTPRRAA